MRRCKSEYLEGVIHQAKKHPRKLWLEVNRLLGRQVRPHIQLLQTEDGEISDSQDIAEALNCFFTYRTQAMSANTPPRQTQKDSVVPVQFTFKPVEEKTVAELLSNVNKGKATGCDGISARALKLAETTLFPSLCGLFNQSITSATLPREWKSVNVTPVHKGGDETNMNNYRPISVLPIVAKILERIVFDQLYDYLQDHSLLTPHQSGFRPGHSTQDVLIKTMDDWRKELDSDHIVSALFVDLSKAFDTIDITICNVYFLRIARADQRWSWIQTRHSCEVNFHLQLALVLRVVILYL